MKLIDADALKVRKFPDVQCNGLGEGVAYRVGWNDAIDAICENEPCVQKWIPVSERLPEDDKKVLCQTITKKGVTNFVIGYYADRWCCGMNSNVIAWQPLPEPYQEEQHD